MARGRKKAKPPVNKRGGRKAKFNEKELKNIIGYERLGPDFIEVECGCTNKKYGDFIGKLRVKGTGQFLITCHCFQGCTKANVTPKEFEKHVGKEVRKWTSNIWVQLEANGEKVPLWKSKLMKYYKHIANVDNWIKSVNRTRKFHKDEFIACSRCHKKRRFRRRTVKEIKDYHAALNNKTWECADWPYNKITCNEEEERDNRKIYRGCPRVKHCLGCEDCSCWGCLKCRFLHCNCRDCIDFMNEGKP